MNEYELKTTTQIEKTVASEPEKTPSAREEQKEKGKQDDLETQAKYLLFSLLKEIENAKNGKLDINKINSLIKKLEGLKQFYVEDENFQEEIDKNIVRAKTKIIEFVKNNETQTTDEELEQLLKDLFDNKIPISANLSEIDIENIKKQYEKLEEAINNKDNAKVTVERGRLIKILKKEKKNIEKNLSDIETLVKIANVILSEEPSIDEIKTILEQKENKNLYLFFKDKLTDLEAFVNEYQKVISDEEIQKLFFLANALTEQLEEHGKQLDERFNSEFLEGKGRILSIFTELPKGVSLSAQKIANSIDELNNAKTQRLKMHSIKEVMKNVAIAIGAPIIFTGKYVVNNWYTLFLTYQGICDAKEQAQTQNEVNQEKVKEKNVAEQTREEQKTKEEKPAAETVTEENPVVETVTEENPAVETVIEEKTVVETVTEEKPVVETVIEENPAVETVIEENPVVETVIEETPVVETVTEENPVVETVIEETPVVETVTEENPVVETVIEENPAAETVTEENPAVEVTTQTGEEQAEQISTATEELPLKASDNPPVTPTPELSPEHQKLVGTQLVSAFIPGGLMGTGVSDLSVTFSSDYAKSLLDLGAITPDTVLEVRFLPEGTPSWQFWKAVKVELNLWEIQEIWNWGLDIDLGNYVNYESPLEQMVNGK